MRAGQVHKIILMLLLALALAGCVRVHGENPEPGSNNSQAVVKDQQPAQSDLQLEAHLVRGGFEPGPADGALTFVFEVSPMPQVLPMVLWVGLANSDTKTLAVESDKSGRYSAVLSDVPRVTDGQVLIELSNPGSESLEVHGAEFALREQVGDRPAARPSRDGRFQVFTKPEGVSPELRLLIGSSEQPLENLPKGVISSAVTGIYTLDFLPAANPDGWLLTMAVAPADKHTAIFYLAKGDGVWRALNTKEIASQGLVSADFAGAGTYMLVREVAR